MAIVLVAADNLRADSMDAATNVTSIGGGAAAAAEPDIFYQGAGAISRKVGTAQRGFYTTTGAQRDMTAARRNTVILKVAIGNWPALDPQTTPGLRMSVGSGTSAFYSYDLSLFAAYPARGGFIFLPIDPNVAVHRDGTTGAPALTVANYFAIEADFSATSKAENVVMDAVDIGAGVNVTGGDGADTDGVFQDFIDYDEGTVGNRFAFVTSQEGILFVLGQLWVGQSTAQASVATEFTDSGKTVVFPDGLFAAGFSGLSFDLGSASTVITLSGCSFIGRGTEAGEDTRPSHTVTSTAGTAALTSSNFQAFASVVLTAAATYLSCIFEASGPVTAAGADLTGSTISNSTATSALLWDVATDPSGLLDDTVYTSAGTGHAIELGANTPATIAFSGHTYTGYAGTDGSTGNEVLYNNSGKAITVNIIGGGQSPTVRNGAGASTTVNQSVPVAYTFLDQDTGLPVEGVNVILGTTAGGTDIIDNIKTDANGEVSTTYSGTTPQAVQGFGRKGSASPVYKAAPLSATISATGLNQTVSMVGDE